MNTERIKLLTEIHESGFDPVSYYKDLILTDLKKDSDLLEILNNPSLSLVRPEDYINTNIYSYLKIPDSQSIAKNFLCFELDSAESVYGNEYKVAYELTFRCVCHQDEVETSLGINRHDLMAAIIKDRFSYSNLLGPQLQKTMDQGYVAENVFYYRTLKFKTIQNNELRKVQRMNLIDQDRSRYEYHQH